MRPSSMRCFVIVSRHSTLVTVILTLAVLLLGSACMVSIVAGESSHLGDHASLMLLVPASISACCSSMPHVCVPYLSKSLLCISSHCHFLSPITSIMAVSILLAVVKMVSFIAGSIILLVTATLNNHLDGHSHCILASEGLRVREPF